MTIKIIFDDNIEEFWTNVIKVEMSPKEDYLDLVVEEEDDEVDKYPVHSFEASRVKEITIINAD